MSSSSSISPYYLRSEAALAKSEEEKPEEKKSLIEILPKDCHSEILSYLSPKELLNFSQVSKTLYTRANQSHSWNAVAFLKGLVISDTATTDEIKKRIDLKYWQDKASDAGLVISDTATTDEIKERIDLKYWQDKASDAGLVISDEATVADIKRELKWWPLKRVPQDINTGRKIGKTQAIPIYQSAFLLATGGIVVPSILSYNFCMNLPSATNNYCSNKSYISLVSLPIALAVAKVMGSIGGWLAGSLSGSMIGAITSFKKIDEKERLIKIASTVAVIAHPIFANFLTQNLLVTSASSLLIGITIGALFRRYTNIPFIN